MVAIDGAGNVTRKSWTINVDPEGHVSTEEAEATLEALDDTSTVNTVGAPALETKYGGTAPGLAIEPGDGGLIATGSSVPTAFDTEAGGGFSVEVPEASAFEGCEESPGTLAGESEAECENTGTVEAGSAAGLVGIEVSPTLVSQGASPPVVMENNSAVSANTGADVDTIVRPLADGGMVFAAIRDQAATENYSWSVELGDDQILRIEDEQHAVVYYNDRTPAFSIAAVPASDANGTTVPTSLSVSQGHIVTLTVHFKAGHDGQPFVFPVVAGTGWEGGFRTVVVDMDNKPTELEEEEEEGEAGHSTEIEASASGLVVRRFAMGPPLADFKGPPPAGGGIYTPKRKFYFNECPFDGVDWPGVPPTRRVQFAYQLESQQCHGTYNWEPFGIGHVRWAIAMSGWFGYEWGRKVWPVSGPNCRHWGKPEQQPFDAAYCEYASMAPQTDHVDVLAGFRWKEGHGDFKQPGAHCLAFDGILPIEPENQLTPGESTYKGKLHLYRLPVPNPDPCPWGHFPSYTKVK